MIPHWISDILMGVAALGAGGALGLIIGIRFTEEGLRTEVRLLRMHLNAVVSDERLCSKPCPLCIEEQEEAFSKARIFLEEVRS